ncbi:MAG TPA: histidinol-phosphate transaminase [Nitrospirota bacterium]
MDIKSLLRPEVAALRAYEPEDFSGIRIKLDAMENPYQMPDALKEELYWALSAIEINRYPDPEAVELRAALSDYLGVPAENILLGNGSDEIIGMLVTAFGGSPGLIAYPTPTFSIYGIVARAFGQETLELPLDDGFGIDLDATLSLMRRRKPKVTFFAYPNNPTGNLFDREKLLTIIREAPGIVAVDEAYFSFSGDTLINEINNYPNLVVLRTLSKIGLAGLRVGIMAAGQDIIREVNKVRLPYNINSLSQKAAERVVRHSDIVDAQIGLITDERARVFEALSSMPGITAWPSKTNFILLRVPGASKVHQGLKARGILVRNMDGPGPLRDCLRVTIGTPEEDTEFLAALKELI